MKAIHATGIDPTYAPVLRVSGGAGNTDEPEVHISLYDADEPALVQGWFRLDELEAAIAKARRKSLPGQRITEPALIVDKTVRVIEA